MKLNYHKTPRIPSFIFRKLEDAMLKSIHTRVYMSYPITLPYGCIEYRGISEHLYMQRRVGL